MIVAMAMQMSYARLASNLPHKGWWQVRTAARTATLPLARSDRPRGVPEFVGLPNVRHFPQRSRNPLPAMRLVETPTGLDLRPVQPPNNPFTMLSPSSSEQSFMSCDDDRNLPLDCDSTMAID